MANATQRKHLPALDGLRGLALLMVFFFHTIAVPEGKYLWLQKIVSLGHSGVDLFFCLSGFLITGILYAAKDDLHYFRNFYARRALRIFPLYYFYLFLFYVVVVRLGIINFGEVKRLEAGQDLHWLWWYGTNIRIAQVGHFITATLNFFWTLAVEEHFYLAWPFLVFWLSRRGLARAIGLIVFGAFALRCWLESRGVSGYVVSTFTLCRVDSFAIGGAVSLLLTSSLWRVRLHRIANIMVVPSGLAALACQYAVGSWERTIGYTCTAIFFSLVIALVATESGIVSTALSLPPLRWVGKYSYALYVFHYPILIGLLRRMPVDILAVKLHSFVLAALANVLIVGTLSCTVSLVTWNLFEKRLMELKRFFPESKVHNLSFPNTVGTTASARGEIGA